MNKKTLFIVGGVVLALALCVCIFVAAFILYRSGQPTSDPLDIGSISTEIVGTLEAPTEAPVSPSGESPAAADEELAEQSRQVANTFLYHLADREFDGALAMTNQEMRDNGASAELFRAAVEDKGLDPEEWVWLNTEQDGDYIQVDGVVHLVDKRRAVLEFELIPEGDQLLISYMSYEPDGISDPGEYVTWGQEREREEIRFAVEAAARFLSGWADADVETAWSYTSDTLRESLGGDQEKLREYWSAFEITPVDWTWDDEVTKFGVTGPHPTLVFTGSLIGADGQTRPMEVLMDWEEGYWDVSTVNLVD